MLDGGEEAPVHPLMIGRQAASRPQISYPLSAKRSIT
jgi:hypothetical protein